MKTLCALTLLAGSFASASIVTFNSQSAFQLATGAGPIPLIASGAEVPIPGGYFVSLSNTFLGDYSATFTIPIGLYAFGAELDNRPLLVGSGFVVKLDGVEVLNTGAGVLVNGFFGVTSDTPFTEVQVSTNPISLFAVAEHGTVTGIVGSAVPEPGTWGLMGAGLTLIGGYRQIRKRRA